MTWQKKLTREVLFFLVICVVGLLFWIGIAWITDQHVIASEYLYARERNGFLVTILLGYFLRLNVLENP